MRALTLALLLAAPAAFAQGPEGHWRTEASDTGAYLHVRIAPCAGGGGTLCGVITEAHGATRTDLPGRVIIRDMAPGEGARWSGGTIWAPDDDRTYRARMTLASEAALTVEGCVLGGIVCRGQTWTRLD
jgi:uncharacterized protein (DUF2147 family)